MSSLRETTSGHTSSQTPPKPSSTTEPLAKQVQYKFLSEENQALRFRLSHVDVSVANALRRTLLSDIPIHVIQTVEDADKGAPPNNTNQHKKQCDILVNTGRLTNEILKHRLSLIPVHSKVSHTEWSDVVDGGSGSSASTPMSWLDRLPGRVEVEVHVQAQDAMRWVTTEDFRLRLTSSSSSSSSDIGADKKPRYLPATVSQQIFPKHELTQQFIEFARLRPKLGDSIPGEELHLVAQFAVGTARENSAYNVVSKCAFQNTVSTTAVHEAWEKEQERLQQDDKLSSADIASRKKDFMCLDAQRHFEPDSFDFVVQTVGIYRNEELMATACLVLQERILKLYDDLRDHRTLVRRAEVTMEHAYDVILEQEDYTLGNLLAYLMLESYYYVNNDDVKLSFCGFKKEHPHDDDSTLRLAFDDAVDEAKVRECLKAVCGKAHAIFERIGDFFGKR